MALQQEQFSNTPRENMIARGFDVTRGTHGTVHREGMGDIIRPGGEIGLNNHPSYSRGNRTYFTAHSTPERNAAGMDLDEMEEDEWVPDSEWGDGANFSSVRERSAEAGRELLPKVAENKGWYWARKATAVSRDKHAVTGDSVAGRAVMHEVEPLGHVDEDPVMNTSGISGEAMTADKLKITDTNWIEQPQNLRDPHVQGTLPNYNWNKQAPVNVGFMYNDYNNLHFSPVDNRNIRERAERKEKEDRDYNKMLSPNQFHEEQKSKGQHQLPGFGIDG